MRDRIYIIDLNTKMYEKPKYKQYDNDIPFRFRIVENGVDVALAGYTVRAFFDNKRNVIQKNCTVRDRIIETKLDNNILAYEGEVKVEITLTKESQITTTFTITLVVEKSINRNSAVELDPGWDIIKDFQTTLDNAIKKAETDIKNTIDKAERDIENTITEANREIESAINQAERDVTDAIGNIPPKSELVGAKGVSMRLKGAWSSSIAYVNDGSYIDLVTSEGNTYACKISNTNQPVSNKTYWELIAKKGDKGDTGAIGATGPQGRPGEEYTHPSTHPATMITEDSTHRFLTDTERKLIQAWETFKASGGELGGTILLPKGARLCGALSDGGNHLIYQSTHEAGRVMVGSSARTTQVASKDRPEVYWNNKTHYMTLLSDFISNLGANGYIKLPDGFIFQWGTVDVMFNNANNVERTITLPVSFLNEGKVCIANEKDNNITSFGMFNVASAIVNNSTIRLNVTVLNLTPRTGRVRVGWMALGK